MSDQTILASDLRVITRFLTSLGVDPAPVLTAAGIDGSALSEPRDRVSVQHVEALLTQLVEQFPDRNLGLALANHHHMTDTHVLGLTPSPLPRVWMRCVGWCAIRRWCPLRSLSRS